MDDYSHCHLFDNNRECVSFVCDDNCRYFVEYHTEQKRLDGEKFLDMSKWLEWEELFKL